MDRPGLTRLMADIEAGLVDCVVVYKVDRLSRSLLDFQGGGVEGLPGSLRGHLRGGKLAQFVIDEGEQLVGGLAVALPGGFDEMGQVRHEDSVYTLLDGLSPDDREEPEHSAPSETDQKEIINRTYTAKRNRLRSDRPAQVAAAFRTGARSGH